jgi:Domain of unknown function (DUF4114)
MKLLSTFAAVSVLYSTAALAFPYKAPQYDQLFGVGANVNAYYVGSSAADTDLLSVVLGSQDIFNNHTTPVGTSSVLGNYNLGADINFSMYNQNTTNTVYSGSGINNPDGLVHFDMVDNVALLPGYNNLSNVSITYADSLVGNNVWFVGVEDLTSSQNSDWDFNDLVFAVKYASVKSVSEPSDTFGLLALMCLFIGYIRSKQQKVQINK